MTRRSKIDILGIGDQVMLWAMNHDVRSIAKKIYETKGTNVDYTAVSRYIQQHSATQPAISEAKVDAIVKVTKDLLESEWADILYEIKKAYRGTTDEEERMKLRTQWQKHIDMILRLYRPPDTQITVDARQQTQGEGLKERLWKALSG